MTEEEQIERDAAQMAEAYKEPVDNFKPYVLDKDLVTKDFDNIHIAVRRLYCPDCGEEIISDSPIVYNPYNFRPFARNECKKCGKFFITSERYPKLVGIDNETGKEVPLFKDRH